MATPCEHSVIKISFGTETEMSPGRIPVYFDACQVGNLVGSRGAWSFAADFYQGRNDIRGPYTSQAKAKKAIKDRWEGIKFQKFTIVLTRTGGLYDTTSKYKWTVIHKGEPAIIGKTLHLTVESAIQDAKNTISNNEEN